MRKKLSIRKTTEEEEVEEVEEVEFDLIAENRRIKLIQTKPGGYAEVMLIIETRVDGKIRVRRCSGFKPKGSGIEIDRSGRVVIKDL